MVKRVLRQPQHAANEGCVGVLTIGGGEFAPSGKSAAANVVRKRVRMA